MQTNILWTGREYHSLENCQLTGTPGGTTIHSFIVGKYRENIYAVEYRIMANAGWETLSFMVRSRINGHSEALEFESGAKGSWTRNGRHETAFEGCIDIDIPLTPFTNTLPINRLKLEDGEAREIKVIYLDLLEGRIMPVRQKYTRISATAYKYENVPNNFEAVIEVDRQGLVVDYPGLFVRSAIV